MFEACKAVVTDIAVSVKKGESYLEKWSLCKIKRSKQDRKELGLNGVRRAGEF